MTEIGYNVILTYNFMVMVPIHLLAYFYEEKWNHVDCIIYKCRGNVNINLLPIIEVCATKGKDILFCHVEVAISYVVSRHFPVPVD